MPSRYGGDGSSIGAPAGSGEADAHATRTVGISSLDVLVGPAVARADLPVISGMRHLAADHRQPHRHVGELVGVDLHRVGRERGDVRAQPGAQAPGDARRRPSPRSVV